MYRDRGGMGSSKGGEMLDWKRINDALDKHLEKSSPSPPPNGRRQVRLQSRPWPSAPLQKKRVISLQTLSLTAALCAPRAPPPAATCCAPSAAPPACCHLLWAVCCAGVCEETPASMADVKAVDEGGGLLDKRKLDLPKSINKAPEDEKDNCKKRREGQSSFRQFVK